MRTPLPDQKLPHPDQQNQDLQGEGNYEAARRYRKSAEQFVADGRVDQAAHDAKPDDAAQAQAMKDAEASGRQHAKR